jgi:trk system potassium uptake protein
MNFRRAILGFHPAVLVPATFLLAILAGTGLLRLPVSAAGQTISWLDALFTATSAVCVTGLIVVDTGTDFSVFGQCVILFLIQIGGLGVMTISVGLFRWIGRSISFRHRMVMQDLFAPAPREDIYGLVKSVLLFTFAAELSGAALLTLHFAREFPLPTAIYTAVFHSVSAFCNAGFSLFPDSMVRYADEFLPNLTVGGLIVVGGIGFPVLYELWTWGRAFGRKPGRLSVHTRAVLWTTPILIFGGAAMFAVLEWDTLLAAESPAYRFWVPLFQSITCRTAGFNTVDIGALKEATVAMMIFLMFFGASPGSCGGGVKTTTLALLSAFTWSRIRRRKRVNMFRKSIPPDTVHRSVSLILLSIAIIGLILFLLLLGDSVDAAKPAGGGGRFLAYFFETVSAFGTVGLSMGATASLGAWGKSLIVALMIVGRVGVLAFAYIVVGTGPTNGVEYSEENLMIG